MEEDDNDTPPTHNLPVVIPSDVVSLSAVTEVLMIVGTQERKKVTKIAGLEHLTGLKELVLRSCLISKIENLEQLNLLEKLEFYDNQITALDCLGSLTNLIILDMSFNLIRDMNPLSHCVHLEEIYLAQNRIRKIEGLDAMTHLVKLDLGANRIRKIENVSNNLALNELWLGKNKITAIEGLETLVNLSRLDLQANRLGGNSNSPQVNTHQLQVNQSLKELFLNENEIYSISDFPILSNLTTIDLSRNKLTQIPSSLSGSSASSLTDLWISYNAIAELSGCWLNVDSVYLEGNPIQRESDYRLIMERLFPNASQIDGNETRHHHHQVQQQEQQEQTTSSDFK